MPFKISIQAYGGGETVASDVVQSPYEKAKSTGLTPKLWTGSGWTGGTRRVFTPEGWKEEVLPEEQKVPVLNSTGDMVSALPKVYKDGEWVLKPKRRIKTVRVNRKKL